MARTKKTTQKPAQKPKVQAPTVNISEDEIKIAFGQYIADQRQAYEDRLPGADEPEAESDVEDEGPAHEEIGIDTWLDAEHVDGTIRNLVAKRVHLQDNVGVTPVFNKDAMLTLAQTLAYNKIVADPRFKSMLPSKAPLPELSTVKGKARTARNREEAKRNSQEKALQLKANEMLEKNDVNEETLLKLFLESMIEADPSVLGNPHNADIAFDECEQLIIPFRKNGNHYTVAVVNLPKEEEEKISADIKFYDSMGSELNDNYLAQLTAFFTQQEYPEINYECVSDDDQEEGHNCAIFASFKAIDIANENAGNPERLLDGLDYDNYDRNFSYFRYLIAMMLKEGGYNVTISDELEQEIQDQQKEFKEASKTTKRSEDVNRCLTETAKLFEDLLKQVQGKKKGQTKASDKKTDEPLAALNSKELFRKCMLLREQMEKALKQKLAKKKPTKQDESQIKLLLEMISAFDAAKDDLQGKVKTLVTKKAENSVVKEVHQWVKELSWKKAVVYGAMGIAGLYLGFPYLLALMTGAAATVPANPILTMVAWVVFFSSGVLAINYLGKKIDISSEKPSSQNEVIEINDDEELEEEQVEDRDAELGLSPKKTETKKPAKPIIVGFKNKPTKPIVLDKPELTEPRRSNRLNK